MKENRLTARLLRSIVVICCTAMSYMGIDATWPPKNPFSFLGTAAWAAYFLILFFWIKNDRAPQILMMVGTILGTLSLLSTFFLGLIYTLPAVALMTYVHILSFKEPKSVPQ